eukprot:TRINITY_DN130_c1_g1_i1.p1 TRINITY_DN130_c1_g1~~TRINITY_DN130_c1_g1_i1.p1  ORF type:complete len:192 (+),score=53.15 TRINITY_DN130_c1_g1_i1:819-1394(+)
MYFISFALDVFDGMAARKFNQATQFGALLDMVSDRCSTAGLLICLTNLYPEWTRTFIGLLVLDMASHYMRMYSSLLLGKHHKNVDKSSSALLSFYYGNSNFLFAMCLGQESFLAAVYYSWWEPGFIVNIGTLAIPLYHLIAYIFFPLFALKTWINVIQMLNAAQCVVELDRAQRIAAEESGNESSSSRKTK